MHVKFQAQYGTTRFLALDKGIRPSEFVEILEIPGVPGELQSDPEWLTITNLSQRDQFQQFYPD